MSGSENGKGLMESIIDAIKKIRGVGMRNDEKIKQHDSSLPLDAEMPAAAIVEEPAAVEEVPAVESTPVRQSRWTNPSKLVSGDGCNICSVYNDVLKGDVDLERRLKGLRCYEMVKGIRGSRTYYLELLNNLGKGVTGRETDYFDHLTQIIDPFGEARECLIRAMRFYDMTREKSVEVYDEIEGDMPRGSNWPDGSKGSENTEVKKGAVYISSGLAVIYELNLVQEESYVNDGSEVTLGKVLGGRGSYVGEMIIDSGLTGNGIKMYREDAEALFGHGVADEDNMHTYSLMRVSDGHVRGLE